MLPSIKAIDDLRLRHLIRRRDVESSIDAIPAFVPSQGGLRDHVGIDEASNADLHGKQFEYRNPIETRCSLSNMLRVLPAYVRYRSAYGQITSNTELYSCHRALSLIAKERETAACSRLNFFAISRR